MSIKNVIICTGLGILFICFAPDLPPHAEFSVTIPHKGCPLEGPIAPNNLLDNTERLHENVLISPESVAFRNKNEIFVGIYGGDIVKVYGSDFEKTKVVANNGPGCAGFWEEAICGRPLGMRFHSNGLLYVADAYLGVFAVDVDTGKSRNIFDLSEPIEGVLPRLADDFDFDEDGNIYWSDASTVTSLDSGALELYADASGRLIKYDINTRKHSVVLDKLHFANGVQMSPKKDFVLVNEFHRKRVARYWLKGPLAGTSDIFVPTLPGMPDNIRARPEGGYFIAIAGMEEELHHKVFTFFGSRPLLKKFLCRIAALMSFVAQLVDNIIPNFYCKKYIYETFNFHLIIRWAKDTRGVVIEIDENGKFIGSMQAENGRINGISEAQRVGNNIFFGSYVNKYLGRIKIKDLQKTEQTPKLTQEKSYEKYEL